MRSETTNLEVELQYLVNVGRGDPVRETPAPAHKVGQLKLRVHRLARLAQEQGVVEAQGAIAAQILLKKTHF